MKENEPTLCKDFLVYQPPKIEVEEVCVEQGFAGSEAGGKTSDWNPVDGRWE